MTQPKSLLVDVRKQLLKMGASETAGQDNEALKVMWDQMQELRTEMNEAKKLAAAEAAKPYIEAMVQIEKRYAMFLKLSSSDVR